MKKIWKQRYQIIKKLGQGGGGSVYKVWDIELEKEWAMKFLNMSLQKEAHFEQRNVEEWEVLKKLSHPNFPRIVDSFEEEGKRAIVMDYIQGVTLEEVIRKDVIKEVQTIKIAKQICDALNYLHQCVPKLIYLDLKPANIIIEENGCVKLVDLGSVSIQGKEGKISGTFGFASPEQLKVKQGGSQITQQSDIFSFGMVVYAMLVGNLVRLPIIDSGSRRGVSVKNKNSKCSYMAARLVEKCTRGREDKRYFSMREVKRELELWEKKIKNRRHWYFWLGGKKDRQWYQEKSIFFTEGNHSFYIAKRLMILAFCILALLPAKKLGVVLRDKEMRKVLVKNGCAYKTNSSVFLEIPWEEIDGKNCRIVVECRDSGLSRKRFYIDCIYAN